MFRILIQLFKDNDFLGSESYSEGGSGSGEDDSMIAVDSELDDDETELEDLS
jgi:hypothetical protein